MGMKRKAKLERKAQNLAELRKLKDELGLEVWQFSERHFRVVGRSEVDYWPSTGKAWPVGSPDRGTVVSPAEVCGMALQ